MKNARLLTMNTKGEFKEVNCGKLDDYYKYLECDTFDIATRNIGGRYYDIYVDDIGLFAEHPIVTAISSEFKPMLVGNLIFANHDSQGNTTSLSDEDIAHIKNNVIAIYDMQEGDSHLAIYPVDF